MPSYTFVPPATSAQRAAAVLDLVPERWDQLDLDLAVAVRAGADLEMTSIVTLADVCGLPAAYLACLDGAQCPLAVAAQLPGWIQH